MHQTIILCMCFAQSLTIYNINPILSPDTVLPGTCSMGTAGKAEPSHGKTLQQPHLAQGGSPYT